MMYYRQNVVHVKGRLLKLLWQTAVLTNISCARTHPAIQAHWNVGLHDNLWRLACLARNFIRDNISERSTSASASRRSFDVNFPLRPCLSSKSCSRPSSAAGSWNLFQSRGRFNSTSIDL